MLHSKHLDSKGISWTFQKTKFLEWIWWRSEIEKVLGSNPDSDNLAMWLDPF